VRRAGFFKIPHRQLVLGMVSRARAESLRNPSSLKARPTVVSSSDISNSSHIHCARSFKRQRTMLWIAGIGPLSTISANARRWSALSFGRLSSALPSTKPAGPRGLTRNTQSRTVYRPTPPIRPASVRRPPS
jgi:hypothetical protein